jgi:hypothetical protein
MKFAPLSLSILVALAFTACANSEKSFVVPVIEASSDKVCVYKSERYSLGARLQSEKVVVRQTGNARSAETVQDLGGLWMTCSQNAAGELLWVAESLPK